MPRMRRLSKGGPVRACEPPRGWAMHHAVEGATTASLERRMRLLFRELAGRDACRGTLAMLTRADFDVAVKEALRHYSRADLLLGSRLLKTRIVAGRAAKAADVARLQHVLADAAQTIFVNERDQRLQRVLE